MFGKLFKNRAAEKRRAEQREKMEKEWKEAREALRADVIAQLSGDPCTEEILKPLSFDPSGVSHRIGTGIRRQQDGTWTLHSYRDYLGKSAGEKTNLTREEAISELVAFARSWPDGKNPPDTLEAMVEKYKDDAMGMGRMLLERKGGLHLPDGSVPDHLYVYERMAGIHDENETCIEIRDANKNTLARWTIWEPEDYSVSGEERREDGLIVAYLAETLDISAENAGFIW